MNSDNDVRRFLEHMAAEPGFGTVDPAPVLRRAYRRLARNTSVLGLAGVTLVAAIAMVGPNLFHAVPEPAPAAPAATVATTPRAARITCVGHGRSHLEATTVSVQSDGLHVAIIQDHPGRRSQVFIRRSGWMVSVGFSDTRPHALPHGPERRRERRPRRDRLLRVLDRVAARSRGVPPSDPRRAVT
jgi:hypothetical protein